MALWMFVCFKENLVVRKLPPAYYVLLEATIDGLREADCNKISHNFGKVFVICQ